MPGFPRLARAAPARELCYAEFGILHSVATRAPLWVGEHLRAAQVPAAEAATHTDRFHAGRRLPRRERSELSDHHRSGFDRGHMAPFGNMPDAASQGDSVSLANMVPRDHRTNTGIRSRTGEMARDLAALDGEVWIMVCPWLTGDDRLPRARAGGRDTWRRAATR